MAFYQLPNPWNPGYAVPEYVMAEPPGRGTFTTKMLPRRTISQLVPDYLARPVEHTLSKPKQGKQGSLSGSTLSGSTLSGCSSLGNTVYDLQPMGAAASGQNPFEAYGKQVSSWIMKNLKTVPASQRAAALKELLTSVDPSLPARVKATTARYKAQGMSSEGALQHAMADEFEKGLGKEIVSMGKGKRPKTGPDGMSGYLGCCGSPMGNYVAISGVSDFLSSAKDKIGDAACSVVTNPLAPAVAGGIAATQGVPPQIGAAGVTIGASMCNSDTAPPPVATAPGLPGWVLPAAIGGGALLLVLAIK